MKKACLPLVFLMLCFSSAHAQNWMRDMHDPRVNFFTVQQEFNDWWAIHGHDIVSHPGGAEGEVSEKWKLYKRWEQNMLPLMVGTNGVRMGAPDAAERDFYNQRRAQQNHRSGATWSYIGTSMSFNDGQSDSVTGRVNCVRFDPVNPSIVYCGTPTGGVWKSVDFGKNWQLLNTDNLPQIGVSDIAVNPQNTNTIYIATGDIANAECQSIGVLKSTDGGQTWDTCGLNFTVSQGVLMARLIMSPLDTNTLFAATSAGAYKTVDGGITWVRITAAINLTGMEFNPLNPNTVYAWGYQLYKSFDAGATWQKLMTGLPDSANSGGFGVGLTPADTSCIYVLASDTSIPSLTDMPYEGVYRSLNGGASFTRQSTNPDQTGTQGTYDLAVGVSPTNRNIVFIGAVNMNYSTNGGVTWKVPTVPTHVDHHDIRFFHNSADTLFSANDGGLFISTDTGATWKSLNNGMHIGEIYNISSGSRTKYLYMTGRQDEGTLLQDTSSEQLVSGGDGLECIIDPLNENHLIGSLEEGIIGSTYGGAQGSVNIIVYNWSSGVNGFGAWNTPFVLQNGSSDIMYVAKDYVYKSTDGGATWGTLHSLVLPPTDNLYQLMAIAPGNPDYIYVATYYHLYRSTDGGTTFTNITGSIHGVFTSLAVSPANPSEIWVGVSSTTPFLLKSVDAGSHFASFATGLPATHPFYPKSIAPVRDSKDALYVSLANAGGVYYIDSTLSSWQPFNSGLPNVTVDQIEIDYCANKIRAATYGRDVWESGPYQAFDVPPVANAIYAASGVGCQDTVSFTDQSEYNPTSWQWYFPGGQPVSSTAQNPVVVYNSSGLHTATFIATNTNGADTAQYTLTTSYCTGVNQLTQSNLISVYPNPNNGNFVISVTGDARGKVTMSLFNNIGQNVYQNSYTKDADVITADCSLQNLAKGIYYLQITTEGTNTVQKIVVDEGGK